MDKLAIPAMAKPTLLASRIILFRTEGIFMTFIVTGTEEVLNQSPIAKGKLFIFLGYVPPKGGH